MEGWIWICSQSINLMTCFFLRTCRSAYHVVTDVAILCFMVEVCWGPMLAAFSVTLEHSDDRLAACEAFGMPFMLQQLFPLNTQYKY